MNKKTIITKLIMTLLVAVFSAVLVSGQAFAGEGGNTGGGGVNGCNKSSGLWTCYGATWRHYDTDSDDFCTDGAANKECGDSYTSSDTYALKGHIVGCKKYGGYWRYAMVKADGSHEQRGVIGIGGNSSHTFDSEFFWYDDLGWHGGMNYIPPTAGDGLNAYNAYWDDVKEIYLKLREVDPETFWRGWGPNSNLAWFCGPEDPEDVIPVEYFSSSDASATGVSSVTTGIQKTRTTVTTDTIDLTVGDTLDHFGFQHKIYSSAPANDVSWSIEKSGFIGNIFYELGNFTSSGSTSGAVNIARSFSGGGDAKYVPTTIPIYYSDYYNIKFKVAGSYEFCEEILVNGSPITKACVKVNVSRSTGYGTSSHVSNRTSSIAVGSSSDYLATDIYPLKGNKRYVETSTIKLAVDETANMTFSHNIYATRSTNNVGWKVTREVTSTADGTSSGFNSGSYTIDYAANGNPPHSANSGSAEASGTANITDASSDIYIANLDSRPYTDGGSRYVHRDFYEITFRKEGTYKFCEYVYLGDTLYTWACSTVEVQGDDVELGDCANVPWLSIENGVTSVASAVMNVTNRTGWQEAVYAKPNDDVEWLHCYYPGVQDRADEIVTRYHQTHGTYLSNGSYPNTNVEISSFNRWDNKFTVSASSGNFTSGSGLGTRTLYFSTGDSALKSLSDFYAVETWSASKVGRILTEKITSGYPTSITVTNNGDHSWSCDPYDCSYEVEYSCGTKEEPKTCTRTVPRTCYYGGCTHGNDYITSTRSGTDTDDASVYVPYNFINTASIEISDSIFYAGESVSFNRITVYTDPKYNAVTKGNYATRVDSARVRVVTYSSRYDDGSSEIAGYGSGTGADLCSALSGRYTYNNCDEVSTRTRTLNNPENVNGTTETGSFGNPTSYDAYDIPAGEYICFVVGVYPYTSGADTQMSASGDNSWYISRPSCHVIAKRPAFQVWGGGISAVGSIVTSAANKNMLHLGGTSTRVSGGIVSFGSWVEQNSNTTGLTKLLSTGAATGLSSSSAGSGSMESSSNFCRYRVPLSFANYSASTSAICSRSAGSLYVGYSGISPSSLTKDALVGYLLTDVNETGLGSIGDGGSVNLSDSSSYNVVRSLDGKDLRYTKGNGDLTIIASSIDNGVTHVVKAAGDVTINGNLQYVSASYGALSAIPKLIVYGENIIIGCSVGRIDAILIADKNVTTCNSDNTDSWDNAHALRINGAIVAGSLSLKRTYGATVGTGSGIPAEVINYDTSILLWEKGFAEGDSQSGFTSVYQKEVSPRY